MSVVAYIVVALAFGIADMLHFRRCAEPSPVRLSVGLIITVAMAAVHVLFYTLGITLGDLLRFENDGNPDAFAKQNAYIYLGLSMIVILKMLMPYLRREPRLPLFSLQDNKSVIAMTLATSINVLLVGIGVGFVSPLAGHIHRTIWPMLILCFVLGYMGIMFGRRKVAVRPRRWMVVASVLLLGTAIAAVVNA